MKNRKALVAVLAAAAMLGTACTSSGGAASGTSAGTSAAAGSATSSAAVATADPVAWTGAYCEGVGPAIEGAVELLKTLFAGGASDPAVQQKAFLAYIDKVGPAMGAAGEKLAKIGPPSAEAKAVHDDIVKTLKDTGAQSGEIRTKLAALDPADPEFEAKLSALGDAQSDTTKVKDQITEVQKDPKLAEAFKKAPQCATLSKTLEAIGG